MQRLKHYGWGREGEGLSAEEEAFVLDRHRHRFGVDSFDERLPPALSDIKLRPPRLARPPSLATFCASEVYDRAAHCYDKSFIDYARGLIGDYANAPDVVAYPRNEVEVMAVLEWAGAAGAAVTPFGGGSSVVGGVEPRLDGSRHKGAVSLDLRHLDRLVEIDYTSRAARIQAGVFGPALEEQLRAHGLTLRHFPQSFAYSTLGGWIATRSGGHFASLYTHIDEFVESLRVVTPNGVVETRRLPGSGAGPNPDRLFIGSEGILGVITEAWMRLQDRPRFRAGGAVHFADFFTAARAVRAIAQSGLYPANCRILDPREAHNTGAGDGSSAVMVLAFESGDHPVEPWMHRALECCTDHGGRPEAVATADAHREGAAGIWRNAFIRMPYAREPLIRRAIIPIPLRRRLRGSGSRRFTIPSSSRPKPVSAMRPVAPARSPAVSHIFIPTAPRPISRFMHWGGTASCRRNGIESSKRRATRSLAAAARSPITMRSGASTGRGTTRSAQICSPPR
jgi:alkyldihydroxyacetonephosphate synthase